MLEKPDYSKILSLLNNATRKDSCGSGEDYMYSSAIDYAGETGLLKDIIVVK
jgi:hypothetical protein